MNSRKRRFWRLFEKRLAEKDVKEANRIRVDRWKKYLGEYVFYKVEE